MDYFSKEKIDNNSLEEVLRSLNTLVRSFYHENSPQDSRVRLHSTTLGADELIAFSKAFLESNITVGLYNDVYQRLAASRFDSKYSITSNSGSSANLLVISSLVQTGKLNPGDYVVVPALAWSTSVFPLVQYGLIPIYVDIDIDSFNIDLDALRGALTEYRPKAIMAIHTYGNPINMEKLLDLCSTYDVILIEDTCESMGAKWKGRSIGSFGIAGTYSSYFSHHICTLEGGITITRDSALHKSMLSIRSHGWTRETGIDHTLIPGYQNFDPTFFFINCGYNLRLSDPQAAIGIAQLNKLTYFVGKRQEAANRYISRIRDSSVLSKLIRYPKVDADAESSWFGFPILISNYSSNQIKQLRSTLKLAGIESRPFLAGDFSSQPVNARFKHIRHNLKNIQLFHDSSFAIPCHQDVSIEDVDRICDLLIDTLKD